MFIYVNLQEIHKLNQESPEKAVFMFGFLFKRDWPSQYVIHFGITQTFAYF